MPNTSYSQALAEVATIAPIGEVMLETLEVSHPNAGSFYLVNDRAPLSVRDEYGVPQTFQASSFTLSLPDSSDEPTQHLNVAIPNVDRQASTFLADVPLSSETPVSVIYRIYLNDGDETQQPQNNPPILLHLTDIKIDVFQITGRASFQSIINTKYPSELYTLQQFPSLGN